MLELKIRYSISEDMLEKIKKIEEKLSKIHIEEQNKKINIIAYKIFLIGDYCNANINRS